MARELSNRKVEQSRWSVMVILSIPCSQAARAISSTGEKPSKEALECIWLSLRNCLAISAHTVLSQSGFLRTKSR